MAYSFALQSILKNHLYVDTRLEEQYSSLSAARRFIVAVKQGWIERILKIQPGITFGQWFYEKITANWPALLSIFTWGGAGTVLVALTETLRQFAPLSWGLAFLLFSFVGAIVLLSAAKAREIMLRSKVLSAAAQKTRNINPLDNEFTRETICVDDLIHPIGMPMKDKVFLGCDFHGPGLVILSGCNMLGTPTYGNVEFLEVFSDGSMIPNKIVLDHCTLNNCRFFNVVIGMNTSSAEMVEKQLPNAKWLARFAK